MKAKVERVEHAAHHRNAEIGFEVLIVIPAECRDAVAGAGAESLKCAGEPPRAAGEVGVMITMDRGVLQARDDLPAAEHRLGAAEDGREGEREVHREAVHGLNCKHERCQIGKGGNDTHATARTTASS